MAGSRERLLHERRSEYGYEYETRRKYNDWYENRDNRDTRRYDHRVERYERPRRKNGYVYEDIYSDFDEAQGRLSLFRPIRPEYLNLPTTYDIKYNSLPRNYYNYEDRNIRRKKDYYDFRIETDRRRPRETYEPYRKRSHEMRQKEREVYERKPKPILNEVKNPNTTKNVAVCKPLRLTDKNARYWTTEAPEKSRIRTKRSEEPKKNVKFSEVSGCNRKMVVDDPICGRKVVPVRELEVSLDQMIQNGYFEKHNIPISRPMEQIVKEEAMPNGKCLSGTGAEGKEKPLRRTRHLPQVSF